jgi:hypothetical protein
MNLAPLIRPKAKPNQSIGPDPYDPNFYCLSCDVGHTIHLHYRKHLLTIHKMDIPVLKRVPKKYAVEPDPDDPDFYCRACDIKYLGRWQLQQHVNREHKMKLQQVFANPVHSIISDSNDPNIYCKSYKFYYRSIGMYQRHLKRTHHIDLPPYPKTKKRRLLHHLLQSKDIS